MSRSPFTARRSRRSEDFSSPFMGLTPQGRSPRHLHFRFDHPPTTVDGNGGDQAAATISTDGIPVERLRQLVTKELVVQPSQAVFYANIVYAKTRNAHDALLLAHAYYAHDQAPACLRVLEEACLLNQEQPWDAVLLACQALARAAEWNTLLDVAQEACRHPDSAGSTSNNASTIDDNDILAWQALQASIPTTPPEVHLLARLACLRAQAYYATGNAHRATRYWKLALQFDCQCQQAYQMLLHHSLVTPSEAHELVTSVVEFGPEDDYLRTLYLAQIELTPQEGTVDDNAAATTTTAETAAAGDDILPNAPELSFTKHLDASSIQMSSPITQMPRFETPAGPAEDSKAAPATTKQLSAWGKPAIQKDIDVAFDKLWSEYKLQQAPQVLAMAARRAYRRYDWKSARQYCQSLALIDPTVPDAALCYICCLVTLGDKRLLFRIAHEWVEAAPKAAASWFAVGAYYYACERYHVAQRHFCRATRLDPNCHEAWIAFGCSFAACDESDQALASFRAAQRLSPGEHMSLLYMGMEYVRTNHAVLASYFLQSSLTASGGDPLCLNEMGVLHAQKGDHTGAIHWFQCALQTAMGTSMWEDAMETCRDAYWEPTLFNLGHSFRKTRQFDKAAHCYVRCISLCPEKHSTYCAVAFCYQLMDESDKAVEFYHKALGVAPNDPFATEMLDRALQQSLKSTLVLMDDTNRSEANAPSSKPASNASLSFMFSPKSTASGMNQSAMSEEMDTDIDMSAMSS